MVEHINGRSGVEWRIHRLVVARLFLQRFDVFRMQMVLMIVVQKIVLRPFRVLIPAMIVFVIAIATINSGRVVVVVGGIARPIALKRIGRWKIVAMDVSIADSARF